MGIYETNNMFFDECNDASFSFYTENGYVVIRNLIEQFMLNKSTVELDMLRRKFADEMGLTLNEYDLRICQWRDLWMHNQHFDDLLRTKRMIHCVKFFMEMDSVQLLHDHIIRKPFSALNETLPWHQDFPFWPVDTPNSLSCWVPMNDVSDTGGCLEVIKKSHKWGISPPVDFIMNPMDFSSREDIVRIPVKQGDIVILNSLTWHRSNANEDKGTNRPAYIALWVPSIARYRPDLAGWHPVNEHVSVEAGQYLNEDKFPIFGRRPDLTDIQELEEEFHSGPDQRNKVMNMFEAAPKIALQIYRITGRDLAKPIESLPELIQDPTTVGLIFENSLEKGILLGNQKDWFYDLIESMLVNSAAFHQHRARNIYNDAYAQWWFNIGSKWADLWQSGEDSN